MKYIVSVNGVEYGPVTLENLERWIREGRVLKTTQVRILDSDDWLPANDYSEFQKAFKDQASSVIESRIQLKSDDLNNESSKQIEKYFNLRDKFSEDKDEIACDYISPAPFMPRFVSGIIDFITLFIINAAVFIFINFFIDEKSTNANQIVYIFLVLLFYIVFLYFSCSFCIWAQTLGMKCVGVIIVKNKGILSKISFLKAFFYTILMICFVLINPFFRFIRGKNGSIQEIFSKAKVIKKQRLTQ